MSTSERSCAVRLGTGQALGLYGKLGSWKGTILGTSTLVHACIFTIEGQHSSDFEHYSAEASRLGEQEMMKADQHVIQTTYTMLLWTLT